MNRRLGIICGVICRAIFDRALRRGYRNDVARVQYDLETQAKRFEFQAETTPGELSEQFREAANAMRDAGKHL